MTSFLHLARSSAILNRRVATGSRRQNIINTTTVTEQLSLPSSLSSSSSSTGTAISASTVGGVRNFSAVGTMAENSIAEWLKRGGDEALQNKGKDILNTEENRHKYAATTFGVGGDYVQSKILADNNIKPPSIERRIVLDRKWAELKTEIRRAYYNNNENNKFYSAEISESSQQSQSRSSLPSTPEVEEFCDGVLARESFEAAIEELDRLAKSVNDAIISDSLRFNGRSPVRHARPFRYRERIAEALLNNED